MNRYYTADEKERLFAPCTGILYAWYALYRPFNWKLEPISMKKEIRNTRLMGLTLVVIGIVSFFLAYIIH